MRRLTRMKRFQFYGWLGAAWLLLWVLIRFMNSPEKIGELSLNETWRVIYIVIVNIIFFEYALPLITRRWPNIIFNILAGMILVAVQLFLISFGLHAWISLGEELNIYTQFRFATLIPDRPFNRMTEAALI